ncbi:MAG TPA: cation diffusion facilitator family transporter [Anaerolineae bacterium]
MNLTNNLVQTEPYQEPRSVSSRFLTALFITLVFTGAEALAGWYANSLALLTDAAHNFTDIVALALSWYAVRLTTRQANSRKTFGYHRAGILVALVNSGLLTLIALFIFYEAYDRIINPHRVQEDVMVGMALVAFVVNAGTAWMIKRGSESDLNIRSAFIHLAGDAISTLGAFFAGIAIALTGLSIFDPIASILIGVLILWSGWHIAREALDILLEASPRDVDVNAMVRDFLRIRGVRGVHDLHVWSLSRNMRALSAHVLTEDLPISAGSVIQRDINELLLAKYGISHAALQLECAGCEPDELFCELGAETTNQSTGR